MKLLNFCTKLVAAVFFLCIAACPLFAEVTAVLDSSSFDWQYNFDDDGVLPDAIDLDGNSVPDFNLIASGTTTPSVSGGILSIVDTDTNNTFYYMSDQADEIWQQSGINWNTGFTMEYRIRLNTMTAGASRTMYTYGIAYDDTPEADGWAGLMNLSPDEATWSKHRYKLGVPEDNSDGFHVFRIAQEPGSNKFSVWRDGVRLATEMPAWYGGGEGANRMFFGDPLPASYVDPSGGSYDIDYLRFTDGAYKPTSETVYTYQELPQLSSSGFSYKYDMNGNPTVQSQVDLDSNSQPDFRNLSGVTVTVSDGIMTMPNASVLESGIASADYIWRNVGFGPEDGFTFELNMKVTEVAGDYAMPIMIMPCDEVEVMKLVIGEDFVSIAAGNNIDGLGSIEVDTSQYHTYRIARVADDECGRWYLWVDGELATPIGVPAGSIYDREALYFGSGLSGSAAGTIEVNYMRLTEGGYAPTPTILGDATHDGIVDEMDAQALANNWLTQSDATWEMGDFNGDGKVDDKDATLLAASWRVGTAAGASVPEPGVLTMLALASLCLLALRRKAA